MTYNKVSNNIYKHNSSLYPMIKKGKSLLLIGVILLSIFSVFSVSFAGLVSATDLDLRVNISVGDYASDVWLKDDSNADTGASIDAYDLKTPTSPSNLSVFSSSVGSDSLAIDSWDFADTDRTINLTYSLPSAQTDTLSIDWVSADIDTGEYTLTLKYYGDDSTYTTQVGSDVVMSSASSYTKELTGEDSIYVQIIVEDVVAEAPAADTGDGDVGGGGVATPTVTTPQRGGDIFIKNKFMDVFIGTQVLDGIGLVKDRKIDVFNEANEPIEVRLTIPNSLKDILLINENDWSFTLGAGERKIINARIVAPEETGIFEGKLFIKGKVRQAIEFKITVTDKELWFDAILWIDDPLIDPGDTLPVRLELDPQGLEIGFDVNAEYTIYRILGSQRIPTGITSSREFFVDGEQTDSLILQTGSLEPGEYVVEAELRYPNEVAVSRASFEIRGKERARGVGIGGLFAVLDNRILLLILGGGAIVLILLIIVTLFSHKRVKSKIKKGR